MEPHPGFKQIITIRDTSGSTNDEIDSDNVFFRFMLGFEEYQSSRFELTAISPVPLYCEHFAERYLLLGRGIQHPLSSTNVSRIARSREMHHLHLSLLV